MCKTCSEDYPTNTVYDNWLLHHKPYQSLHADEINLLDVSLTAILTFRLNSFSVEELVSEFGVSKEKALEIASVSNRILVDMQEMLLSSMQYK